MDPETEKEIVELIDKRMKHCGFDPEQQAEFRDRVHYFKKRYEFWKNVYQWATRSAVVLIVAAIGKIIYEGIKAYLKKEIGE